MKQLSDWFVGYEHAHGSFQPTGRDAKGKVEGIAVTHHEPITQEMWEEHLAGGKSLGVIALRDDNTVRWGAADVDRYTLDLVALSIKLAPTPLVLFRTKSGGAHLVCFVRDPVPAAAMVSFLQAAAARLGFGGCEIFPKQVTRALNATKRDPGSWLNMPYANAARPMRYAIHDGKSLSLDEALELIEQKALSADEFLDAPVLPESEAGAEHEPQKRKRSRAAEFIEPAGERFNDGPPCLQLLAEQGGFPNGSRNEGMFNVGVYVKKKHPDDWKDKFVDYRDMCNPPFEAKELGSTIEKSLSRKDYSYKCTQPPIAPHCNRPLCLRRAYGVGQMVSGGAELGGLTKYEGTPVMWVIEVEGKRLELTTEELQNQNAFARKCAEVLTMYPRPVPGPRWAEYLHEEMKKADVVPAQLDEETVEGHFWVLVERFCVQRAQGKSRDQVTSNYPYTEKGWTWFRGAALIDFLKRSNFQFKNNREIKKMLKERDAITAEWDLKNGKVTVWGVPEFKEVADQARELPSDITTESEEF